MRITNSKAVVVPANEGKKMDLLGNAITIKLSKKETEGNYFVFECVTPPGHGVPPHIHHHEDELIYVVEGELTVMLNGEEFHAKAGDEIFFPRYISHSFHNSGVKAAKFIFTVAPGKNFEEFFETLTKLPSGEADMQKIIETFEAYGMTVLMKKPA